MKIAIYSRKSVFTGKGESIENQIQLCNDYINSHYSVSKDDIYVYQDEGYSGSNTNRPMFKKLLSDANSKKFDCLVCYRLDRISRNISDFSSLIEHLNKLNIDFVSIKEQFDTSTPMGRAMLYISSVFAQLERETIAERVRDNMYELAKTGRWLGGRTPYGFKSSCITYFDENMTQRKMYKLETDKESMEVVKYIFNKYIKLGSLTKLHKHLYENGIKGPYDGSFSPSSVSTLLRNPAYVNATEEVFSYLRSKHFDVIGFPDNKHGLLTYAKNSSTPIAALANHEGVICAKDWIKVQQLLDINSNKAPRAGTGSNTLLSGILKCSICGSSMRLSYKSSANGTIIYYVCGKKKTLGKSACSCKNIRADIIEPLVISRIKNVNVESMIKEYKKSKLINKQNNKDLDIKISSLSSTMKEKEKLVDNLVMQLAKFKDSLASSFIIKKIEMLNNEILNLKSELDSLKSHTQEINNSNLNLDVLINNLNRFNDEIDNANVDKKKLLLNSILESVDWSSSNNTLIINYVGFNPQLNSLNPTDKINSKLHF
ncbi:recombinase family protein [Clostridium sp. CCUG 7971]|uniref:recombinase family protein n=1 Tax=Clostridium sp. CCUG 7971 TaxID=2811414 RepID=UPI001ABB6221|nr:recombinase family protein [Clostridium sp. CCUG 7971]MBO3444952.1 recombinase family protein [Clostridium sp. CCUG 7971]